VTVYVVVVVADDVGLATDGLLRPVVGSQAYVYPGVPPLAVGLPPMTADEPLQKATSGPALAVTAGNTVTWTKSESWQLKASVTTTV
jgi:hypothetical protein